MLVVNTRPPEEGLDSSRCRLEFFVKFFRLKYSSHLYDIHWYLRSTMNHPSRPVTWNEMVLLQ